MQLLVLEKCIALLPARQSLEVFQLSAIEGPVGFTMVPALHFLNTLPLQLLTGGTVAGVNLAAASHLPAGEPLGGAVLAGVTVCSTTVCGVNLKEYTIQSICSDILTDPV